MPPPQSKPAAARTSLSEPELKRRERRRWLIVAAILVMAGGLFAWKRESISYRINYWRAGQHLEKAKQLADEGELQEAMRRAESALQLKPESYQAQRLLAKLQLQTGGANAGMMLTRLALHPDASDEERVDTLRIFLRSNSFITFAQLFEAMPSHIRDLPDAHILHLQYIERERSRAEAEDGVRAFLAKNPDNGKFQLLLAQLLFFQGGAERLEEARELLQGLLSSGVDLEISLPAFQWLRKWSPSQRSEALTKQAIDFAERESETLVFADRLFAAGLRIGLEPTQRGDLIDASVAAASPEDLGQLCGWLVEQGSHSRVLQLADETDAMSDGAVYEAYLDALFGCGQNEIAEGLLAKRPEQLAPTMWWLLKARLATEFGDMVTADQAWSQALSAASIDKMEDRNWQVAQQAGDFEKDEIAYNAMAESVKAGFQNVPKRQIPGMVAHVYQNEKWSLLLDVLRQLGMRDQVLPITTNNLCYLRLLLSDERKAALQELEHLTKRYPDEVGYLTSVAFGLLQKGAYERALRLLEDTQIDWAQASEFQRAVFAKSMQLAGDEAEGEKRFAAIAPGRASEGEKLALRALRSLGEAPPADALDFDGSFDRAREFLLSGEDTREAVANLRKLHLAEPRRRDVLEHLILAYLASDQPAHASELARKNRLLEGQSSALGRAVNAVTTQLANTRSVRPPDLSALPARERKVLERALQKYRDDLARKVDAAYLAILHQRGVRNEVTFLGNLLASGDGEKEWRLYLALGQLALEDEATARINLEQALRNPLSGDRATALAKHLCKRLKPEHPAAEAAVDWAKLTPLERDVLGASLTPADTTSEGR